VIIDRKVHGLTFKAGMDYVVIFVQPKLSFRSKLMVLAHEYGHHCRVVRGKLKNEDALRSERMANRTAVKILKKYGISEKEFKQFYEKATDRAYIG
jgi:uncharacterized protein YjaZ